DATGELQPIPADELFALRKRLAGRSPEVFGSPVPTADAVLATRPDPRVKQLADRLADVKSDATRRQEAVRALAQWKEPAVQSVLVSALRDPDAGVRVAAESVLGGFEPRS